MALIRRGSMILTASLLLATLALTTSAFADIIHRKSGPPIEGTIVSEPASTLVVTTAPGTVEIKKSDIQRIERKSSPAEEFKQRLAKLRATDMAGYRQLALWAEANELRREARKVYERMLKVDPDDAFANRALGRVEHDGKWYTPAELKKVLTGGAADTPPARPDRKSEPPSTPEREPGPGRSNEPKESDDGIASMVEKAIGERPTVVDSEHFRIATLFDEQEARTLLELAETVHEDFTEMIEEREGRRYWNLFAEEFFLSSRGQYLSFMDRVMPRYINSKKALDFWKTQKGNAISSFPPIGVSVRKNMPLRNTIVHHAAKHLVQNYVGPRRELASWLTEGFAYYMEFKYEKAARVIVQTAKMYGGGDKVANKHNDSSTWAELVKTSVIDKTYEPFDKLKHTFLNDMDYTHLAQSWSMMTFLINEHEEKFMKWMKNMRKMAWEKAWFEAYHWTGEQFDKEWSLWVTTQN